MRKDQFDGIGRRGNILPYGAHQVAVRVVAACALVALHGERETAPRGKLLAVGIVGIEIGRFLGVFDCRHFDALRCLRTQTIVQVTCAVERRCCLARAAEDDEAEVVALFECDIRRARGGLDACREANAGTFGRRSSLLFGTSSQQCDRGRKYDEFVFHDSFRLTFNL